MILKFELNEVEQVEAEKFIKKHNKTCKNPLYSFTFSPTGIGIGVSILCEHCKNEKNITDYKSW